MGGGHRKAECHCWGARVHSPLSLPVGKFHARGTGTQKIFWDTGWVGPMVPPYTAAVRANVWDTVSAHVRQQLLQCKGIRIPTLGSFDTILERVQVGAGYLAVQRPVFYLARNLAEGHRLTVDMSYMPGNKGRNTALILRDIGMLLIEDAQVQMKYYCDFLEAMSGKVTLKGVLLRVPGVPGSVIPRSAAPAFLTRSGCVIVFPEFELQCIHCVPFSGTKKGWQKEAAQDMNGSARDQRPAGKHPREEKPPAAQHGTALGGTAGRQGVKLKGTSLAMKAFLQTGTQGLEQR
ncbi:coiled-coil domain-containing protein 81-like isoform X2 [Coturnix japonica]|uniref:coiled-coil domain-containing protein 81-like isoform X2 n=1 Tax=Coturnix japonica TaxID=93934 RepID=UPI000776D250|nr:coiled-coil domain-containing protein 81-like isoform X2 [Coturnix japonica]